MWTTNYHCHINMLLRWWGGLLVYFVYLQFCTSLPQLIHSAYSFLLRYAMPLIDKEFMPGTIVNWIEIHSSPFFGAAQHFCFACIHTHCCLIAVQWSYYLLHNSSGMGMSVGKWVHTYPLQTHTHSGLKVRSM